MKTKPGFKIKTITAFIATEDDGTEGVIAMLNGEQWMPLIGADEDRIKALKPFAKEIAETSGCPAKMVRFSNREDLEDI